MVSCSALCLYVSHLLNHRWHIFLFCFRKYKFLCHKHFNLHILSHSQWNPSALFHLSALAIISQSSVWSYLMVVSLDATVFASSGNAGLTGDTAILSSIPFSVIYHTSSNDAQILWKRQGLSSWHRTVPYTSIVLMNQEILIISSGLSSESQWATLPILQSIDASEMAEKGGKVWMTKWKAWVADSWNTDVGKMSLRMSSSGASNGSSKRLNKSGWVMNSVAWDCQILMGFSSHWMGMTVLMVRSSGSIQAIAVHMPSSLPLVFFKRSRIHCTYTSDTAPNSGALNDSGIHQLLKCESRKHLCTVVEQWLKAVKKDVWVHYALWWSNAGLGFQGIRGVSESELFGFGFGGAGWCWL